MDDEDLDNMNKMMQYAQNKHKDLDKEIEEMMNEDPELKDLMRASSKIPDLNKIDNLRVKDNDERK